MTKRQAELIIALLAAVLLSVVIVGASVLRGIDLARTEIARTHTEAAEARREAVNARKEAEAAQTSAEDTMELQKQAAGRHILSVDGR